MQAKKHLGQHFLVNRGVIDRIIDSLEPEESEAFLEIGPGPATLTRPLNDRGFGFTVVEFDGDMVSHLKAQDFEPPLRIIHADFMEVDLADVVQGETKVVSNLPYNMSVPITARLLEASDRIPLMMLMYQKEVAERVRAMPHTKDYGPISVVTQCFYDIDLYFNVKPGSFRPPPKVMSQVIRLRRKTTSLISLADLPKMTELVRHLFHHRRKTLGWNIKKWRGDWTGSQALLESLQASGLDAGMRAEALSPSDYARWFHTIKE